MLGCSGVVHPRDLGHVRPGDLPCVLDHPGEGPVEPLGLVLDLPEHLLREVKRLLPLVGMVGQSSLQFTLGDWNRKLTAPVAPGPALLLQDVLDPRAERFDLEGLSDEGALLARRPRERTASSA